MKNILAEYINIIAYTVTGIVFGFAFFLLFLNLYHYEDVNETYKKQASDYKINSELKEKLNTASLNINSVQLNNTINDYKMLSNIELKLNTCLEKINTNKFDKLLSKNFISISDVYEMQQFYKIDISNECLVKQLYGLTFENNQNEYIDTLPFIEDNIEKLKDSTDYVEKVIKNNSSYSFTSSSTKMDIYNQVRDSYYSIVNDYVDVIDFIYDLSVWYKNISGGNI